MECYSQAYQTAIPKLTMLLCFKPGLNLQYLPHFFAILQCMALNFTVFRQTNNIFFSLMLFCSLWRPLVQKYCICTLCPIGGCDISQFIGDGDSKMHRAINIVLEIPCRETDRNISILVFMFKFSTYCSQSTSYNQEHNSSSTYAYSAFSTIKTEIWFLVCLGFSCVR